MWSTIKCGGRDLENVFRENILAPCSLWTRINLMTSMAGSPKHSLDVGNCGMYSTPPTCRSPSSPDCRYQVAVCSILTYRCETWSLTTAVMKKRNGVNTQQNVRSFYGEMDPTRGTKHHLQFWPGSQHSCSQVQIARAHSAGGTVQSNVSGGGRAAQARHTWQHPHGCPPPHSG